MQKLGMKEKIGVLESRFLKAQITKMKAGSGTYKEDSLNLRGDKMSRCRLGFCRRDSLQPVLATNEDNSGGADWKKVRAEARHDVKE
ncbi:hypothetical protein PIB30_081278 [Stylosanthes scabra]|uniref:Uncharacterized protein n=1 Tax=Stylosanthes scabra TaxID=79078 RepID=A0ABU6SSM5_9FABA|nr:hypothetical protein [Stylosanthes scabra]